jgi:DNA polymerase
MPPPVSDNAAKLRARARLALRAERALGLGMLPSALVPETAPAATPASPPAPAAAPPPRVAAALQARPSAPPPPRTSAAPNRAEAALSGQLPFQLDAPFTAPLLSRSEKIERLKLLDDAEVRGCTRCRLCETRTNTVFGEGDADAKIFFIGEGPGENEDLQGRPFIGRAGELLNKWIAAMGLQREQVFIANIVKCRPPGNREPVPDEVATCTPYLLRQIEIIRPSVLITLGRPSSQYMLQTKESMGKMRGRWHEWRGIKLMPTYHPAYVLRSYTYETRSAVWSDLQLVMKELKLPIPARSRKEQS